MSTPPDEPAPAGEPCVVPPGDRPGPAPDVAPGADPARWTATGLVGVPATVLASTAFNEASLPLHVSGVRQAHAGLFAALADCPDAEASRDLFASYMAEVFALRRPTAAGRAAAGAGAALRWKASYLRLLQGWGLDANGAAGAVLKGWAESRFGLLPVFHKVPLERFPAPAWIAYLEEKSTSRYLNNDILQQLDLVFEFCQWMLQRFQLLGPGPQVTLWRGSNRIEEQVVQGSLRSRRCTVRLNNLVSFSTTREQAGAFGDWLLCARVPLCKLLLVPGLLNTSSLRGEAEVLAIGGLYDVQASYD